MVRPMMSPVTGITQVYSLTLNHAAMSFRRLSGFRSVCHLSKSATRTWKGALPLFLGGAGYSSGGGERGGEEGAGVGIILTNPALTRGSVVGIIVLLAASHMGVRVGAREDVEPTKWIYSKDLCSSSHARLRARTCAQPRAVATCLRVTCDAFGRSSRCLARQ